MAYSMQERAMIWLCACAPVEERERIMLLRAAHDPAALLSDFEKICPSVIKEGKSRLYNSDRASRERELDAFLNELDRREYFAVTLLSEDYPALLKETGAPPLVLYGAGERALLSTRMFCIVGSRLTPPWAEKQARIFAEALSERFTIVTGLAEGGDSAAIEGALRSGKVISVLPNGLNECYPASHASLKERVRRGGLLLSEYLPTEPARKYSFHARNRILAGLAEGVLVVSAGKRSGTSITANYALDYGRDVFAFPYNLGASQGEGCNELIKKGAYLVSEPKDVFSVYGMEVAAREESALSPEEEKMLLLLRDLGEAHVGELAERTGLPVYEVAAVLSALELKNRAVKAGGNRYAAL